MPKQKGRVPKIWNLYYHLKAVGHPVIASKAMPSHREMLGAGAALFGVDTAGKGKRDALDMILDCLPQTGPVAKARKDARAKRRSEVDARQLTLDAAYVVSDAFLASYEWKRARYSVLKKHDGLCEVCGRGRPHGVTLNVDHIKPRRKRPDLALDASNLQVTCSDCNIGKGNWDETDWRGR